MTDPGVERGSPTQDPADRWPAFMDLMAGNGMDPETAAAADEAAWRPVTNIILCIVWIAAFTVTEHLSEIVHDLRGGTASVTAGPSNGTATPAAGATLGGDGIVIDAAASRCTLHPDIPALVVDVTLRNRAARRGRTSVSVWRVFADGSTDAGDDELRNPKVVGVEGHAVAHVRLVDRYPAGLRPTVLGFLLPRTAGPPGELAVPCHG